MLKRGCGVLLHVTSLPGKFGIGDFGPNAFRFADFLAQSGQKYWQILPLSPTDLQYHNSPYRSVSAFAINPLFISPELLVEEGLLNRRDISQFLNSKAEYVDYESATKIKKGIWKLAFKYFKHKHVRDFKKFSEQNSYWLEDYALFTCLKDRFRKTLWFRWPDDIRKRNPNALCSIRLQLSAKIEEEKFLQYIAFKQWQNLKKYCNELGIQVIGDLPIYVEYNSSDVWANSKIFKLDRQRRPYAVAGVPPDYFSKTGQLWGNPLYNWKELSRSGYKWWIERFRHNFKLFGIVRVDHFRGFMGYWQIPYGRRTASGGKWVKARGCDFFKKVTRKFRHFPIIAEDLGVITTDVKKVMRDFSFPGMKVLLFAFLDNNTNPYLPHNVPKKCVMYTGTHDNNTISGWLKSEATLKEKQNLYNYIGKRLKQEKLHWEFINLAIESRANIVILPMQDILGLGDKARMNKPAVKKGNWRWRLRPLQLESTLSKKLLKLVKTSDRF